MRSFQQYLNEIAANKSFRDDGGGFDWARKGSTGFKWDRNKPNLTKIDTPSTDNAGIPVKLGYDVYNVFQRYWYGQNDPLHALLSRRGSGVDWVTVFATPEEVKRLKDVALEIITDSDDVGEVRTAKACLERLNANF